MRRLIGLVTLIASSSLSLVGGPRPATGELLPLDTVSRPSIEIGRFQRFDLEESLVALRVTHDATGHVSIRLVVADWSVAPDGSGGGTEFFEDSTIHVGAVLGVTLPDDLAFEGTIHTVRSEISNGSVPRLVIEAEGQAAVYVAPRRDSGYELVSPESLVIERTLGEAPSSAPLLDGKTDAAVVTHAEGAIGGGGFLPAGVPLAFKVGGQWLAGRFVVDAFAHEFDASTGWTTRFTATLAARNGG